MAGIKIPVEAAFEKGSADDAVKEFQRQFNALGETIARLNKMKFTPLDKASVDHIKQVNQNFSNMLKINTEFAKRMKVTGGSSLFDAKWDQMYPDPSSRARQMHKVFNYVTGAQAFQQVPAVAPPPPPVRPGAPAPPPPAGPRPPSQAAAVLQAGLSASGMGGIASGAAHGMQFGIGAGLAGLVGGIVALGVGKLVGAVREKIGAAQQELIGYDTLKRQLGDVNVSFDALKSNLRLASNGLGLTYDESLRLGTQFTKTAGLMGDQTKSLPHDVRQSVGFSRAFGLDPAQGVGFFSQMRLHGATRNTDENRRLGLLIGEGVAKAGAFSKMDEVLEAIAGYVGHTARTSLTAANVGGYTSFLTSMVGSHMPGTDPASSAAMIGRANSAFSSGGSEAMQNFLYRALGGKLGLDPFQTQVLREGGLFASGSSVFGEGSVYSQFMGGKPGGAAGSKVTNLQMVMEQLDEMYAGKPKWMKASALASNFGLSNSQAMMFSMTADKFGSSTLGSLEGRLKGMGMNLGDIDPTAVGNMAAIEASSMSDAEKNAQIAAVAKEGQIKTEGDRTRETISGLGNTVQAAAEKLVSPLNDIRSGIMYMAGGGKMSPREVLEQMAQVESRDRVASITGRLDPQIADAEAAHAIAKARTLAGATGRNQMLESPEERAARDAKLRELEVQEKDAQARITQLKKERADALSAEDAKLKGEIGGIRGVGEAPKGGRASAYDALFAQIGKEEGVDPRLLKAIAEKESGFNALAISKPNRNGSIDVGLMQHNSRFLEERGLSDGKWKDPATSIRAAAKLLKANGADRDLRGAVRRYNGSGPAAEAYADDVMGRVGRTSVDDKLPMAALERDRAAGAGRGFGDQALRLDGTFRLVDQAGNARAAPAETSLSIVRRPAPAGAS